MGFDLAMVWLAGSVELQADQVGYQHLVGPVRIVLALGFTS